MPLLAKENGGFLCGSLVGPEWPQAHACFTMQYEGSDRDVAPPHVASKTTAASSSERRTRTWFFRVWSCVTHVTTTFACVFSDTADKAKDSGCRSTQNPSLCVNCPSAGAQILAAVNPCSRSAKMSSMCSMPTASRTRPGVTPAASWSSGESCECVVDAGWMTRERTSPMLAT